MSHINQTTTRSAGKRTIRPPLLFSSQLEFIPTKFGISKEPIVNDSWGEDEDEEEEEEGKETIVNDVSNEDTRGGLSCGLFCGSSCDLSCGCSCDLSSGLHKHLYNYDDDDNGLCSLTDEERMVVNTLASMKTPAIDSDTVLYQKQLWKHGKVCGECGELSLGCEEDQSDMQWYCQPCWKKWTDNHLSYVDGIVEFHEIKIDPEIIDSWYPTTTDTIVYATKIDYDPSLSSSKDLIYGSRYGLSYTEGESDEYAIVYSAYESDSGYMTDPVYLILSTGTIYPIEGSQNSNSPDYNPIIDEVVHNLTRSLTKNLYD